MTDVYHQHDSLCRYSRADVQHQHNHHHHQQQQQRRRQQQRQQLVQQQLGVRSDSSSGRVQQDPQQRWRNMLLLSDRDSDVIFLDVVCPAAALCEPLFCHLTAGADN